MTVQFSSVTQSCPTLCDPINCSTPGLSVHHQLPEFTQTHVHRVSDAIHHLTLCHPLLLLPPTPPKASESFPMSQLFAWGGQSTGVSALASFLPKNTQGLISFRMDWTICGPNFPNFLYTSSSLLIEGEVLIFLGWSMFLGSQNLSKTGKMSSDSRNLYL